jgi:hypothetical protein
VLLTTGLNLYLGGLTSGALGNTGSIFKFYYSLSRLVLFYTTLLLLVCTTTLSLQIYYSLFCLELNLYLKDSLDIWELIFLFRFDFCLFIFLI